MSAFEEFGMMPELIQAMEEMEWYLPRPVQAESIPLILGGGDVMCAAETGSGKTGAFCLPIIQTTWEVLNRKIDSTKKKQALNFCRLNRDDCDQLLGVSEDGLQCMGKALNLWAGVRANYGAPDGAKYYFEVKIMDGDLIRIGWSTIEAERELGTDRLGFGYGSTGKKSFARQFDDYGAAYGKGAVVGCILNRVDGFMEFTLNGKSLGPAFNPIPSSLKEEPLFPAITIKNGHVVVNFGDTKFQFEPPGVQSVASLHKDLPMQERFYERFLRLKEQREQGQGHLPTAIIIEPTLELAQQVADELDKFIKFINNPQLKYCQIVGRKDTGQIMRELKDADIIVGTPGRLVQMLESRQMNVSNIRFLVLDEADRLSQDNLDIIMKLYRAILQQQKERLQVCMFSATLHSPEITTLAQQICPHATWVDLKGRDFVPETVHHGVIYVDPNAHCSMVIPPGQYQDDLIHARDNLQANPDARDSLTIKRIKPEMVCRIIEAYHMEQCLIFCRTRLDCDNLKDYLDKRGGGKASGKETKGKENPYSSVCLHSGFRPNERKENLDMFKEGDVRLLICTDVAARGIDIKELPYVINVTLPDKDEDYIHRVGRVGRADRMGLAVSIVAKAKEKVWYHTCPSRGEGCTNTNLVSDKGCAIWYDEPDLIKKIETRIQEKIPEMGPDFRHPAHKAATGDGEKVVYGKSKQEAAQGVSEHIRAILTDVDQLLIVEREAQQMNLSLAGVVAGLVANRGKR